MRKPVFLLLFLLAVARAAAQDLEGPGSLPIEINSTGQTTYENGLATARDNVAIHFGDTDIYSDFAQYDEAKRTIFLKGHVRIYRGISLYTGEQGDLQPRHQGDQCRQHALRHLPLSDLGPDGDERLRRGIHGQKRQLHDATIPSSRISISTPRACGFIRTTASFSRT